MRPTSTRWTCCALLGLGLALPAETAARPRGATPAPTPAPAAAPAPSSSPGEIGLVRPPGGGPGGSGGAGAAAMVEQAQWALAAALNPPPPGAETPGFAAAAERLRLALERMRGSLAARDAGFFVVLRDGSRALVELRTVWRRLGAVASGGQSDLAAWPLADLTAAFRLLLRHFGAEEQRYRLAAPLSPTEGRQLARVAAAARGFSAGLRQLEAAAAARPPRHAAAPRPQAAGPAGPPGQEAASGAAAAAGSGALDAGLLAEVRQLAALLDRIAAAPATLEGYLNALTRTDAALGTWAGDAAFLAANPPGEEASAASGALPDGPEPAMDDSAAGGPEGLGNLDLLGVLNTAAADLASGAGAGFVFAADLDSGRTWSYLKEGSGASGATWTSGSSLDPFDEYDDGGMPVEPGSLVTPAPGDAAVFAAGNSGWPGGPAGAAGEQGADPAAAAADGEELARRLGGTFAGGKIVIHGGAGGGGIESGNGAHGSNTAAASDFPGAGDEGFGLAWSSFWLEADPLLDWLEGAPAICSSRAPRCAPVS
jgi:hypothetical protein